MIDSTSRWPEAVPLSSITVEACARAFISARVLRLGFWGSWLPASTLRVTEWLSDFTILWNPLSQQDWLVPIGSLTCLCWCSAFGPPPRMILVFSCRGSSWYSSFLPRQVPQTPSATLWCFSPTGWTCSYWFLRPSSASCNPSASTLIPPDCWVCVCL